MRFKDNLLKPSKGPLVSQLTKRGLGKSAGPDDKPGYSYIIFLLCKNITPPRTIWTFALK